MRSRQKISRAGLELIERFEGLRRTAARLPDGRWTIGYGHTRSARAGAEVSQADAEALLQWDLLPVAEAVDGLVSVELSQNQFDALTAFAYNVGVDAFRESDVLKRVNQGRLTEAALALDVWRKAEIAGDPAVLDVLVRRRAAEKALFLSSVDGLALSPSGLVRPAPDAWAEAGLPMSAPAGIEVTQDGDVLGLRRTDLAPVVEPGVEVEAQPQAEPEPAPQPEPEPAPVVVAFQAPAQATVYSIAPVAPSEVAPDEPALPDPADVAPPETVTVAVSEGETAAPAPAAAEPVEAVLSDDIPTETESELQVEALEAAEPGAEALAETPSPDALPAWAAQSPSEPASTFVPSFDAVSYFAPREPASAPEEPQPSAPEPEPSEAEPLVVAEDAPVGVQPEAFAPVTPVIMPPMPERPSWQAPDAHPAPAAQDDQAAPAPESPPEPPPVTAFTAPATPAAQDRTLAERTASLRLYGPMGVIGMIPLRPPASTPEAPAPAPPAAAEPATTFGPPAVSEPEVLAHIAAGPGVSTDAHAPAGVLVLTPPPDDWDPDAHLNREPAPPTYEPEDEGTPLFDQAWAGGQTARIVRHEEPIEPVDRDKPAGGLFVLLGVVGVTAFAGSLAAFLRGRAGGADEMTIYAWILCFIGAASVATAVYFLLKRWSGGDD